jgi:hypothetical protein
VPVLVVLRQLAGEVRALGIAVRQAAGEQLDRRRYVQRRLVDVPGEVVAAAGDPLPLADERRLADAGVAVQREDEPASRVVQR